MTYVMAYPITNSLDGATQSNNDREQDPTMIQVSFSVTQSDGSDESTPGTWGWRVTCTESDGTSYESDSKGYPSREAALEHARSRAADYCRNCYA